MVICKVRDVFTIHEVQEENHSVRWAGAGGWCWSGVREKHCWLAGGWRLQLESWLEEQRSERGVYVSACIREKETELIIIS